MPQKYGGTRHITHFWPICNDNLDYHIEQGPTLLTPSEYRSKYEEGKLHLYHINNHLTQDHEDAIHLQ